MTEQGDTFVVHMVEMREEEAVALAREMLDAGFDPLELLGLCRKAMDEVGTRFENNVYYLPELMMAGEMLTQVSDMAKPLILESGDDQKKESLGKILIGTVHGDLHDIGKNIVTFMLEINGFEVIDLGIDVPIADFIEAIKEHEPHVVGLSGFLTLAFDSMKETVEAFEAESLSGNFKIMVGGGQIDDTIRKHTGADAFGLNAMEAVNLCKDWMAAA